MYVGTLDGITKEIHSNGNIRYRIAEVSTAPGVWISKSKAFERLYRRALFEDYKAPKKLEFSYYAIAPA